MLAGGGEKDQKSDTFFSFFRIVIIFVFRHLANEINTEEKEKFSGDSDEIEQRYEEQS